MTRTAESSDHRVTIIVPTYRDWARMALCLQSLAAQTYPASLVEILVVNNEPSDPPPHDLCAPANCRILDEPKKGSYAARNTALKEATGDILLFTDSDCIAEPDWCAQAVAFLERNPGIERFGGEIEIIPSAGGRTIAELYESTYAFEPRKYVSRGWAPTANMGAWRRVFKGVGPFDDDHYSGGDGEWGSRATQLGISIGFCENALVHHPARTLPEILRKRRRIAGAMLNREIKKKGSVLATARFVTGFLRHLLPPTWPIARLAHQTSFPIRTRLLTYFFIYYMRLNVEIERARILLLGVEPERR